MCEHENFEADIHIARVQPGVILTEMAYIAELQVRCAQCGTRFTFKGVERGHSWLEPRASAVGFTLFAPMEPDAHLTSMLAGHPESAFPRPRG